MKRLKWTGRTLRFKTGAACSTPTDTTHGVFRIHKASAFDGFLFGACSIGSSIWDGPPARSRFSPSVAKDDPWDSVGHFVSNALIQTVEAHPSLPALPDDLYSPVSVFRGTEIEHSST